MIRRKQEESAHNHERWVISYADFITLLFAFFVVMYSISSVNEGKYKVLSNSLENVFSEEKRTLALRPMGDIAQGVTADRVIQLPVPGSYPSEEDYKYSVEGMFDDVTDEVENQNEVNNPENNSLKKLSADLASTLEKLIDDELASITNNDDWIEVDIRSSVLFPSGGATLSDKARKIVVKVAQLLKDYENPIHVEGFTDNIPIQNDFYPSNWELSAARAAAVVRLMEVQNVAPSRMAAVGYAEFQPVADNATAEGRAKNRRVSLIISKQNKAKEKGAAVELSKVNDFKIGAVPERENRQSSESTNAFNPKSRQQQKEVKNQVVPLKIIKLNNGGILFSSESTPAR